MDDMREKERDRSKRGDRPSRFSDMRDRSNDRSCSSDSRKLYVSNIPYEFRWTELKDLFKEKVGDVSYVELYQDDNGKPRGCGVVEFTNVEAMKKALLVMHRYDLNGRKMVLREESHNSGGGNNNRNNMNNQRGGGGGGMGMGGGMGGGRLPREEKEWNIKPREPEDFNTYGLSLQFLESINVQPPLVKKIFVANLDYKVDRAKIKELFKMSGKVRNIDLAVDKDGNSRGFAVIEYDHPVEAVQAISLFDKQTLYDRRLTVRMDRGVTDRHELKLPEGLKGIGLGLGPNGEPQRDVARNLPQSTPVNNLTLGSTATSLNSGVLSNAGVSLNGLGTTLASNTLNTGNALGGGLGLQALGLTGLGALQNQLLQQGLTANDLATVLQQANASGLGLDVGGGVLGGGLGAGLGGGVLGGGVLGGGLAGQLGGSLGMKRDLPLSGQGYGREAALQPQSRDKTSDMVVITNLPPTVTWQLIREKFSECGEVKFAEMTAPDTAIVRFQKEWDADRAIKMFDRTRIDGRTIDVRFF